MSNTWMSVKFKIVPMIRDTDKTLTFIDIELLDHS